MRTTRLFTTLAFVLALGLAGCAQDGGGVATLQDDSPDSYSSEDDVPEDPDEAIAKFKECLEDHGVDPDDMGMRIEGPGRGRQFTEEFSDEDRPKPPSAAEQQKFDEAMDECEKYIPTVELSPEEDAERRESAVAYAQCMRDKGFDIPDPKVEGGGMSMLLDESSGIDPNDPAYQEANEECMEEHMGQIGEPPITEEG